MRWLYKFFFFFFSSPSHFHRKPCQSCDLVWHLEAPQGTCSTHSSERKLGNLENSDVKTTFVEQTVPHRHGERWKEKESIITVYEAHCGQKKRTRERCYRFIKLKLGTHTHTHGMHAAVQWHTHAHTEIPQSSTELNGGIAGSSRLEMRWESGQGDKEWVVLFISLVQCWAGQGWRDAMEEGRSVDRRSWGGNKRRRGREVEESRGRQMERWTEGGRWRKMDRCRGMVLTAWSLPSDEGCSEGSSRSG